MLLRDYQRQAIDDLRSRWDAGAVCVPMVLATGLGKGHPLDTEVPTPDGYRMWGDLREGDSVLGRDGRSTTVLAIYDRGVLPTYRVSFSDGSSVEVDGDHLWAVRDSGQSYRPWITTSTAELARHELKRSRGWRFHVPMVAPVEFQPGQPLPLGAYTVGALIANGGMTRSGTTLTTPDAWVAERVRADGLPVNKANYADPAICDRYSLPGLTQITRELGMRVNSKVKRIPPAYLVASLADRIALLHGLMDGDGAKRDTTRRSVAYFTSSPGLAEDVSQLVTSLGGTGIVKTYDRGAKGVEYAVRILLPSAVSAFSQGRKADNGVASVRELQPKRAIVSIEPVGEREIRCIRVAAPDSLYLITRQHIVTHNTVIFSTLIAEWLADNPGKRALVIAHTNELIEQAAASIKRVCPSERVGIVKGARNNTSARVIVSSRQTLASERRRSQIRSVGLIVIDEAHHCVKINTYGKILQHFGALASDEPPARFRHEIVERASVERSRERVLVAGFTATLARSDKKKLASVWEECSFSRDILFGIRNGYLLDVKGERVVVDDLDLKNVSVRGGDYSERSLADELERSFAIETIAKEYERLASDRKGIAFWPLVATAEHAARVFSERGIASAYVSGAMDERERKRAIADLRAGRIQVLHNAMVLTEGFDDPSIECVVMGRPTKSPVLFQQCVGRALRPDLTLAPSERRPALVIDVTGASEGNDLRSLIDLSPERSLAGTYDEHPDATLSELEEMYALAIEEEIGEQRAGASATFASDEWSGATTTRAFDPLARSKVWGQTSGGVYYVKASVHGKADAFVFIVESLAGDPGTYDIVQCSVNDGFNPRYDAAPPWQRGTEHVGLHLDMALSWGEELAGDAFNSRKTSWRRGQPSEGQQRLARVFGVDPAGLTAGELSEAVDRARADRRIDALVAKVKASVQESGNDK